MSRCFPYPPPGYTLSGASGDALIESIKLQKEREKAKAKAKEQRKMDKEKKKEKRKEKREKKKEKKGKAHHQCQEKPYSVQGHADRKRWTEEKGVFPLKRSETEPEQLSSLTEEHGQSVCVRVPSTSSDSTENSNKRKWQDSPMDTTQGPGKVIRIRLSSKKQNESNASTNEQLICSTSGRTELCSQDKIVTAPHLPKRESLCSTSGQTNIGGHGFTQRTTGEQHCRTPQQAGPVAPGRIGVPPAVAAAAAVMTKMQKVESHYKKLVESWTPPQHNDAPLNAEDLDWLLPGKSKARFSEERQTSGEDISMPCSSSSMLCPHSLYLQEIGVHALPFTVPF